MHYQSEATQEIQARLYWGSCCSRVPSLNGEDPLQKRMATHSSILAWKIPWTEEPGGLQSMGSQKSWTRLSTQACMLQQGERRQATGSPRSLFPLRGHAGSLYGHEGRGESRRAGLRDGLGGLLTLLVGCVQGCAQSLLCSWFFRSGQGLPRWH